MKFAAFILLLGFCIPVQAQSVLTTTNAVLNRQAVSNNPGIITAGQMEAIRSACITGRRCICGKIIQILPDGLVVYSGYTDLLRAPLNKSWLVPGVVTATRPHDLIERNEPDCAALGPVFLTNLPKSRSIKPKLYDYVILTGYPAGYFSYKSIGSITHTVRRFTGTLARAVELNPEVQLPSDGGKK